jgi:hypothetical protein
MGGFVVLVAARCQPIHAHRSKWILPRMQGSPVVVVRLISHLCPLSECDKSPIHEMDGIISKIEAAIIRNMNNRVNRKLDGIAFDDSIKRSHHLIQESTSIYEKKTHVVPKTKTKTKK